MKKLLQGAVILALFGLLAASVMPRHDENTPYLQDLAQTVTDWAVAPACAGPTYARDLLQGNGNMFCVTNPTIGTTVNYANSATYGSTTALMVWQNAASSTKYFLPDHVRLKVSGTAPGNVATVEYLMEIDSTSRTATSNAQARLPVNVNGASTVVSSLAVQMFNGGGMTVPAATATARTVSRGTLAIGPVIAGDEFLLRFGDDNPGDYSSPLTAARATAPARFVGVANPTIVPPGWFGVLHLWMPGSNTGSPAMEYEACWLEQ